MATNNKVYIGNLPYTATREEIEDFFSDCGEVGEVRIITDRETDRSKGFGFVTFNDDDAFQSALKKDEEEMGGRKLRINEARDRA
jgi:cold-inducible RNA-binding protein